MKAKFFDTQTHTKNIEMTYPSASALVSVNLTSTWMLFFIVRIWICISVFYVLNLLIFDVASCRIWARAETIEEHRLAPRVNFPTTFKKKTIDLLSFVHKHSHTHTHQHIKTNATSQACRNVRIKMERTNTSPLEPTLTNETNTNTHSGWQPVDEQWISCKGQPIKVGLAINSLKFDDVTSQVSVTVK